MSVARKRNRTSPIWSFFSEVKNSDQMAQCDICSQKISYKSSITNLKMHLRRKHPTVNITSIPLNIQDPDDPPAPVLPSNSSTIESHAENPTLVHSHPSSSKSCFHNAEEPSASTSCSVPSTAEQTTKTSQQSHITSFLSRKINHTQKKKIDSALMKLFTLDFQPFSVVEDRGFREFVRALNESYELPNRKTISSSFLPAAYEQCLTSVQNKLSSAESVCLTTDSWTSKNNDSYLAVTAHYLTQDFEFNSVLLDCTSLDGPHTSSNLAKEIKTITDNFNLSNKILIAVTDNASNIKNAVTKELKWKHFGCYAHTLNLIVQEALKETQIIQDKVKAIVAHFKRSTTANKKLLDCQRSTGTQVPKKLIQEVPTRWNSTYHMLSCFVELKDPVRVTTALSNAIIPVLTEEEWEICTELCTVLKPFDEVTKELSGQKYITGSEAIPLTRVLTSACKAMMKQSFKPAVKLVVQVLYEQISLRFMNIEKSNTLALCTFLDPRFRMPGFSDIGAAEAGKKNALELATKFLNVDRQSQIREVQGDHVKPASSNGSSSIWDEFDKIIVNSQPQGTATSGAIVELRFMQEAYYPRHEDPLLWWRKKQHNYPVLSKVVREKFGMVASSVPCERIFSKAGVFVNEKRTRLSSQHVRQLLFLNANYGH